MMMMMMLRNDAVCEGNVIFDVGKKSASFVVLSLRMGVKLVMFGVLELDVSFVSWIMMTSAFAFLFVMSCLSFIG